MTDRHEALSTRRRLLLLLIASCFLVWQVPAMDLFDRIAGRASDTDDIVATVGFVLWALALAALLAIGRRAGGSERDALEDELVQRNRQRAFLFGYVAMLLAAAGMFVFGIFLPATALDAAQLIMAVGVVVPIYSFVVLDSRNG